MHISAQTLNQKDKTSITMLDEVPKPQHSLEVFIPGLSCDVKRALCGLPVPERCVTITHQQVFYRLNELVCAPRAWTWAKVCPCQSLMWASCDKSLSCLRKNLQIVNIIVASAWNLEAPHHTAASLQKHVTSLFVLRFWEEKKVPTLSCCVSGFSSP